MVTMKAALRTRMRALRAALPTAEREAAAASLARQGLGFLDAGPGTIVSGFLAIGDEPDTLPLLTALRAQGLRLALPVMQGRDRPLLFRAFAPGDAMDTVQWGIREPKSDQPLLEPDVLLVPLLAFDARGHRLGYGGGYYDRTLRALRARRDIVAVGLGLDAQRVDAVPHLDYDERLDWVLLPSGPLRCRS